MRKPRLFIASSAEAIPVANAINVNLDHDVEVTIWKNGTFKLSSTTVVDLLEKSSYVDFAVFIFTPDDVVEIRDKTTAAVRDNVFLELGLFVGALGKDRCFILVPRGVEMHIPSDLIGMTTADYDPGRSDNDLVSAVNRACSLIQAEISNLGLIDRKQLSSATRIVANPVEYKLKTTDFRFLAACLQSRTSRPEGISFNEIKRELDASEDQTMRLSAIKLEKMGLVEIAVETDHNNHYDYLAYRTTDLGVDFLLDNEDKFNVKKPPAPPMPSSAHFDEDIPF